MIARLAPSCLLLCAALVPAQTDDGPAARSGSGSGVDPAPAPAVEFGRIEKAGDLRLVRVWGSPEQRGHAQGLLLGDEIAALIRAEFHARFLRRERFLELARNSLDRLIDFPEAQRRQIEALFEGLRESGADLGLPDFERQIDLKDLMVVQALDVFGLMGCSGFTAWGRQVEGGGVLTGRNFDWPFSGRHMVDNVILLVEHDERGGAVASVTWPGYLGAITAVDQSGVAVFLHTGNAKIVPMPEPDSYPTAIATRALLEQVDAGGDVFAKAEELLGYTSPPIGFITRVILPAPPEGLAPVALFEADAHRLARTLPESASAVTNHFLGRSDVRGISGDSRDRLEAVQECLRTCLDDGDHRVSPMEGWDILRRVERGGGHAFGTLHSLVFRAEPWYFALRIADYRPDEGLVAAPDSKRAFELPRELVFPEGMPGSRR